MLAAASDIAPVRFLGETAGGLSSTGEGELRSYYGGIENLREQRLKPQLIKLLEIMGRSTIGSSFNAGDIDIIFQDQWTPSASDEATTAASWSTTIANLINTGVISSHEAHAEAQERKILVAGHDYEDIPE